MAILPAGSGIHGYPTRRFRVRNLTCGSYPYPTRDKIGSGTGLTFYPRVLADIRNFQFTFFQPTRNRPAQPNVLYSNTRNPSFSLTSTSRSASRTNSSQKPPAATSLESRKPETEKPLLSCSSSAYGVDPASCRPAALSPQPPVALPHCRPSHLPHCPAPRQRTTAEVPTLLLIGVRRTASLPGCPSHLAASPPPATATPPARSEIQATR
jgi:hypothetical protein